jgi:hypothetical protein
MAQNVKARDTTVPVTIYLPRPLYEWLIMRKARGHGPLTQQVAGYCQEGRIRTELDEAADAVNPDPRALEQLRARIRSERPR